MPHAATDIRRMRSGSASEPALSRSRAAGGSTRADPASTPTCCSNTPSASPAFRQARGPAIASAVAEPREAGNGHRRSKRGPDPRSYMTACRLSEGCRRRQPARKQPRAERFAGLIAELPGAASRQRGPRGVVCRETFRGQHAGRPHPHAIPAPRRMQAHRRVGRSRDCSDKQAQARRQTGQGARVRWHKLLEAASLLALHGQGGP